MAITQRNYRNNGGGEELISQFVQLPIDAVESLCVYELGYGGNVNRLTDTLVEVRTQVLSCRDRTIYEGPAEEMLPLLRAAYSALHLSAHHNRELLNAVAEDLSRYPEEVRGKALFVTALAPMLLGSRPAMVALLSAANVSSVWG